MIVGDVLKIILVVVGVVVLFVGALLLWIRFASVTPTGQPTAKEAEIAKATQKTAGEIAAQAEAKQNEVLNADKPSLVRTFRERGFRRVRKPKG